MKAIDLFCGCGGLTVGLKNAGYEVVGAIDNEPVAVKTYKANHPEVQVWEMDIRKLTGAKIRRKLKLQVGELDLLAGCPPCQGFSRLTTLNGAREADEERKKQNDLLFQFVRLVDELRPKAIMLENVPGLFADARLDSLLNDLRRFGYHAERDEIVQVLNVANYGVPQRRHRLILMTSLAGPIPFAEPLAEQRTVHQTIGHLKDTVGKSGDVLHDMPERRSEAMMARIRATPHDGGSRLELPEEMQVECHRGRTVFKDVYGRMSWHEVSPTMTCGCHNPSKGRFLHPDKDRAITLREASLFQTFPENYHFSLDRGKTGVAKMIGNALPPVFIEAHARQIIAALREQNEV